MVHRAGRLTRAASRCHAAAPDAAATATTGGASRPPRVAVVGAGWAGLGAAKALCEQMPGVQVTLLDGLPDPTGRTPVVTASGKPFEAGQRGFWKD